MRLMLLAVGRMKQGPERELLQRYAERASGLARNLGFAGVVLREIAEGSGRLAADRQRAEADALRAELVPGSMLVALDERGKAESSAAFASLLGRERDAGRSALTLVIGGPDGLDASVRDGADRLIAYGAATFPHQLVRVMAAEQIYRALTILAGHPYHRA